MDLTRPDFAEYFAELHDGHAPFAWQERLLDAVLESGTWPDQIIAPTGAGKTAVIDVHVFAQALTANDPPPGRPPRRLSLVVGRRVLVDDQFDYAQNLSDRLASALGRDGIDTDEADPDPARDLMGEIAQRLWRLRRSVGAAAGDRPLVVGKLRGGQPPSRGWRIEPTAAAVLCATPDMWGSRLLFRGYGSSTRAWPVEAGLLAFDTVVVVDEAHLSRQLLVTARRVARLAAVALPETTEDTCTADTPGPAVTVNRSGPVRPLQVVETTATPPEGRSDLQAIGVHEGDVDLPGAATLRDRLTRPKPLTLVPVATLAWNGTRDPQRRAVVNALADAVDLAHAHRDPTPGTPPTVGCYVNTVRRAVEVAAECRSRGLWVVMVCGRTRARDLDRLRTTHPGVLDVRGNLDVDVVVATQSLEVGVDLDFAALVTELAEASALAQRAGRVNRRGLRPSAPVTVVTPQDPPTEDDRSGPYDGQVLADALTWVQRLALDPAGMSPWRLRADPPPPARPRRIAYQQPELAQAWHWARTSEALAADPELDLWLADDLENNTPEIGLVVRAAFPVDPDDAVRLVTDLKPTQYESFPVNLPTARELLRDWRTTVTDQDAERSHQSTVAVVVRGDDVTLLNWTRPKSDTHARNDQPTPVLRPGDIVVIDSSAALFTTSALASTSEAEVPTGTRGSGFSPPVPVPDPRSAEQGAGLPQRYPAVDVLTGDPDCEPVVGEIVLRLEPALLAAVLGASADDLFGELARSLTRATPGGVDVVTDPTELRAAVREWLVQHPKWPAARAAAEMLEDPAAACDVVVHQNAGTNEDQPETMVVRVLVIDRRRIAADDEVRQVWTPSRGPVTLQAHQAAVAARARTIGTKLALPPPWIEALRLAGAHHDDGKADDRFQVRLGRRTEGPPLAKSVPGLAFATVRRRRDAAGLPRGWRHEQLSVLHSWPLLHQFDHPDQPGGQVDPALVSRLVGTSHGHGRTGFPHVAAELCEGLSDVAGQLFDEGGWDTLMERTQRRYGVWLCAYLEALLRAADNQVSGEGS